MCAKLCSSICKTYHHTMHYTFFQRWSFAKFVTFGYYVTSCVFKKIAKNWLPTNGDSDRLKNSSNSTCAYLLLPHLSLLKIEVKMWAVLFPKFHHDICYIWDVLRRDLIQTIKTEMVRICTHLVALGCFAEYYRFTFYLISSAEMLS